MKFKVSLSAMLLVLLGSGVLWAGDPWKEKPYTQWTVEDVDKVLQNSPWAKQIRVSRSSNVGPAPVRDTYGSGGGARESVYSRTRELEGPPGMPEPRVTMVKQTGFSVRWGSSLTIREAVMRNRQLQMNLSSRLPNQEQVEKGPSNQPEHYVIFLEAREGLWFQAEELKGRSIEEFLLDNTYLQPKHSREKLPPLRVARFRMAGLSATQVVFYFPRKVNGKPTIRPDEKKVKFQCKLRRNKKVDVTFDLRKMVRDGKPDL